MRPVFERNFISKLNEIQEGLNFIVPSAWWNSFRQKNENIKCYREMRLSESYPLDCLLETGIIEQPHRTYQKQFKNIQKDTEVAFKTIRKQLKRVEASHEAEYPGKRAKIPCQWLWEKQQSIEESDLSVLKESPVDCDLLLLSPQIKADMADLFQIRSEDWNVVSPELYKMIWQQEMKDKRQQSSKTMVAIPVLISKDHTLYIDQTIDYQSRKYVEIFIKNCSGLNFCFIGFVDGGVKFKHLIKWIDEGMYKLVTRPRLKFTLQNKNMVFALNKKPPLIAYSFDDDLYNENLQWTEFRFLEEQTIQTEELHKIIVFVGANRGDENQQDNFEADCQVGKTEKKRPGPQSRIKKGCRELLRAGVKPRIFSGQQGSNFQRTQVQTQIIDVHSSTQEQTPSQLGQKDVVIIQSTSTSIKNSRIPFSIWKEALSPENLNRLAHIRLNVPRILKPFSDQAMIVLKDEGKKIILPKQSNSIILNDQNQPIQKEAQQKVFQEGDTTPCEAVRKQLQHLALQILGMKISEKESQIQKAEVDLVKESSECEDKTCKNDDMDEFDCQESRQF